jgi:phosphodiesterase/alkaline phosphatase D-like protein
MSVNRIAATITAPFLAGLAVLVFSAAPALAVAPEVPETGIATGETTTTATLHGVLNPGTLSEPPESGSYQFDYAPAETGGCTGSSVVPASPTLALGAAKEKVEAAATGLESHKQYLFCVVAYSLTAEPSQGAAVPFETLPAPPKVDSESASAVGPSGATLETQVNPNNEHTNYIFEYSEKEKAGKLEGMIVKVDGASELEGGIDQTASVATGTLLSDTTYYYRVVAENEQSKKESKPVVFPVGSVQSFTTTPEAPETLSPAKSITATTGVLEGVLNPKAATAVNAGWHFAYSNPGGASCLEGPTTASEPEAAVKAAKEAKEVKGLQPDAKYTFCLVATNEAGAQSTMGNEVSLTTSAVPPAVEAETTSGVTPYEAVLEAQVNPNNQTTTYTFEYSTSNTLAGATTLKGAKALSGYGVQTVSGATGRVLEPGKIYYYRVVAKNEAGEEAKGAIENFPTPTTTAPVIEGESSSVQSPFAATLETTINPDYQLTTCAFEYATSEAAVKNDQGTSVPCAKSLGEGGPGAHGSAALTGLSSNTTYYFRVTAANGAGTTTDPTIGEFTTNIAEAPVFDSERSRFVTAFTAELEAVITPSFQSTTCELQYGTVEAEVAAGEGTTVPCKPEQFEPTDMPDNTGISLTGLQQNTTYYYRVVAKNATGATIAPTVEHFTTLLAPAITPDEAQSVTSSTVVFAGGTVNPEGNETRYHIMFVPASEYEPGAVNPYAKGRGTLEVSAGSETTPQPVTKAGFSELKPSTTYHYAIIATSPAATTIGADQTFTTGPATTEPPSTTEQIPTTAPQLPASPFTNTSTPAFIPYTSIAALDATEAHENKGTGTTKKTKKSKKKKHPKHKKHDQKKKKK